MKRPAGIIASAVILVLISIIQALFSLGGFLVAHVQAAPPPLPRAFFYALSVFILLFAVWGIITTIGVYRLRQWARYSILIIGGCMAGLGFISIIGLLAAMFIPLPPTPGADPAHAQEIVRTGLLVGAMVYAVPLGIGTWWLIYFNRKPVRALFAGPNGEFAETRRPLLISIYSVIAIFGGLSVLIMAFMGLPAVLITVIIHGWGRVVFYFIYGTLHFAAGIGLWKLKEWARRLSLALLGFSGVQLGIYLVHPSLLLAVTAESYKTFNLPVRPTVAPSTTVFQIFMCGFSLLFTGAIAYMLHHYRARFAEPDQLVAQQPPAAV